MKLENVVTRMGIPLERPFHDALSDTLYTADLCRMLDLRAGLAAYPSEEDTLRQSLCPTPGDYRDFKVFRGLSGPVYVEAGPRHRHDGLPGLRHGPAAG